MLFKALTIFVFFYMHGTLKGTEYTILCALWGKYIEFFLKTFYKHFITKSMYGVHFFQNLFEFPFTAALDDMDLVVVVQTLITKCMENSSLRNEFCLQLIKQSTDMKSGNLNEEWLIKLTIVCARNVLRRITCRIQMCSVIPEVGGRAGRGLSHETS